jgi:DNA polymerase-3 subunit epsilon
MSSYRPIFFDLETTGTRPDADRIIEIAAFDPVLDKSFQRLVHPGIPIPSESSAIHQITDGMVANAPSFASAGAEFIEFCSGNVYLVAHNGEQFDLPFLRAECKRHKLSLPRGWGLIDTLKWSRKYRRDLPRHSLQYLRELFGIPPNHAHRALDDVIILHRVFSILTDDLTIDEIADRADAIKEISPLTGASHADVEADAGSVLELFH